MTVNRSKRFTGRRLWRALTQTVQHIRARNAGADPDEIQRLVDEARREVRRDMRVARDPDFR